MTFDNMSVEELYELTGQSSQGTGKAYPFQSLTINKNSEDDNENVIPAGTYAVYSPEHKEVLYGKPVAFRPFMQTYQYRIWDEDKKVYSNRTILFKNWNDEKFDELGGLACGKVARKQRDQLTAEQQAEQDEIRCSRVLFGTVSLKGVFKKKKDDKSAREGEVVSLPVMWRTSGKSFIPVGEAIDKFTNKNMLMFNHTLTLTTKRDKTGSNVYYTAEAEADLTGKPIALSAEDITLMRQFQDFINSENAVITDKWRKASLRKDRRPSKDIDLAAELAAPEDKIDDGIGPILGAG